jgi:hypothetical protein
LLISALILSHQLVIVRLLDLASVGTTADVEDVQLRFYDLRWDLLDQIR